MNTSELKAAIGDGYAYVASPYSGYPDGTQAAFEQVAAATGDLIGRGVHSYSPIAHTHPVAEYSGLDKASHDIWMPADKPLMNAARAIVILALDGWRKSYGVSVELDEFDRAGKPIFLMNPETGSVISADWLSRDAW